MAKRFTETKIWDDVWFQDLPIEWKLFWKYLCDKCDEAGVWKVNKTLAEFQLKTEIKWDEVDKYFNSEKPRIDFFGDFWFIKDFVTFQYGEKVFTSEHPFHKRIRGIIDRVSHRVSNTLLDRVREREKVIIRERVIIEIPPKMEDVVNYCKERNKGIDPEKWYNHYQAKGWLIGKNKMKDWRAAVRTWEKNGIETKSQGGAACKILN